MKFKTNEKVRTAIGDGVIKDINENRIEVIFPNKYIEYFDENEAWRIGDCFTRHDLNPNIHVCQTQTGDLYVCTMDLISHKLLLKNEKRIINLELDYTYDFKSRCTSYDDIVIVYEFKDISIDDIYKILELEKPIDIKYLRRIWERGKKIFTINEVCNLLEKSVSEILGFEVEIIED